MRVFAGAELAMAVSAAGGIGFIGPNAATQKMKPDLEAVQHWMRESEPSKIHSNSLLKQTSGLPVGVGFQLWSDDLEEAVRLVEQYKPVVVWLYAPREEQRDFAEWSSQIRNAYPDVQIWIQIGTLAEAQRLLRLPKLPDTIVVQGAEAGGHGRAADGIGLTTLVPEVIDYLSEQGVDIPVLAAGGLSDGRGAAAALCLGASGVVMGTRFLAATEARISRGYQQEIVRASDGAANTTRTLLYNHLRGTFGWPKEYAPRTIINRSYIDHQKGTSFEDLKKLHDEHTTKGDEGWGPEGRLATYAGASIGLIKDVKDASQIVQDVQRDVRKILGGLQAESQPKKHL